MMPTDPRSAVTSHQAKRLTIMATSRDHAHHHSLMVELLRKARRSGLSGGTVLQAQKGFGTSGKLHQRHLFSEDAPLALVIVDEPERIEVYLESVGGLLEDATFVTADVDVIDG